MRTPVCLRITIAAACLVSPAAASAQYVVEDLGRCVIALRVSDTTVYIGWRLLGTDPAGIAFNVYRTAGSALPVKLNIAPITETDIAMLRDRFALAVGALLALAAAPQVPPKPPEVLPAAATAQLTRNLGAAKSQRSNIWRDSPGSNPDGTINGYVEIARGDRRKWEFDVGRNARVIDRVMPPSVGAYPVNYGFVPQTVSYDGDPFDILVLGPAIRGGTVVRGVIVGLMHMTDEKGLDSKVVVSPVAKNGSAIYALTPDDQERIGGYFKRYKLGEPGKFSTVPGWGSASEGRAYVAVTHAFFRYCRRTPERECALPSEKKAPAVKDFEAAPRAGRAAAIPSS